MRISCPARRKDRRWERAIAVVLAALMIGQFSPALAGEVAEHLREVYGGSFEHLIAKARFRSATPPQPQDTPQQRAAQVSSVQLCPRQLKLYVEETFAFVPVGMDNTQKIVHGVSLSWQSSAPGTVSVQSTGEVTAVSPGTATVTVTIGTFSRDGNRTSAGRRETQRN